MVIVVSVMLRFACSLLCYVVLYSVIMFYLLVFSFICLYLLVVHVDVGDVRASRYAMFSGYELLWIWWIVMWYPHDDVDIMFMYYCWHHVILSWLNILHSSLTGFNWTWTTVGWVMVPLNRCWPVQPCLPEWDGPNWVYCRASRQCLQWGKVMGMLYPGPIGKHNLVCPLLLWYLVPVWDHLCFCHGDGHWCLW